MPDLLITNGRVVDPSQGVDALQDLAVVDGKIAFAGSAEAAAGRAGADAEVLDATGLTVVPGLIDMHVHLREPGTEEEETIASGAAAAVAGGFTSVACMPNTDPAIDSETAISFVIQEASRAGLARVFPVGAITAGRRGEALAEMAQMADAGAVAFSDDGAAVPTAGLLRQAMSYARMLGKPILEHCENPSLAHGGLMHEGAVSTSLGLPGIPAEAEEVVVARDVALARLTSSRLHVQHISTRGSVEIVRRAKAEGIQVTAEVTPHHLTLSHDAVRGYDPDFKVNPPLRSAEDVNACLEGLRDGTIDVIASDHAPHLAEEKEVEFQYAPFGMIGLETTVGVLLTHLVDAGLVGLSEILPALTTGPAAILGLELGSLRAGCAADLALLDLNAEWVVDPKQFKSKSANCPFRGQKLSGQVAATVVDGRVVYKR